MVTGVQASMPTGAVTVGVATPAQHVPQEAVQPPSPQQTNIVLQSPTSTTTGSGSPSPMPSSPSPSVTPTPRRSSENRRSNKPIMEKRRRARINNCLNDLKALILDAMKKDPARHSKLEKADILEMTVKHLESMQRQQVALASATDPTVLNKFRAGFTECASEVGKFPGLEASTKRRLMAHLASCLSSADGTVTHHTTTNQSAQSAQQTTTQLQVHILPQVDSSSTIQVQQSNGIVYMNANGTALQLVPTRLPNGNIALVAANAKTTPPPSSNTSTASASSSSVCSTSTSAASPVAFEAPPSNFREESQSPILHHQYTEVSHRDVATSPAATDYNSDAEFDPRVYSPPLQKPLSLVMRKSVIKEVIEEKCWRPW
ncbi:hypothetical protein QAD02_011935 [Eretmocerus hayati]|uniref:Uncharacterized protein n=1 Tax=Eretmocerus hayati TaxID=131215 RepID=A0ACC2NXZ9_9HYME|nr:hypothetical protein QAD02_011935 [Eretmocerus hayati]